MSVETPWRVYYTDDRTFDSDDHDWMGLPDDGVLAVATPQQAVYGFDWYFVAVDIPHPIANNDPKDANRERYGATHFKRGRWVAYSEYHEAKTSAQDYARGREGP